MPATGYLTIRAYTSAAQLPIVGAAVSVTRNNPNGGSELIALRLTDESGKTPVIPITTPELAGSLSPGTVKPFASVDVLVDHPDYERILVENVQIFPGVLSLQNLELIPYEENPEAWNMTEVVDITTQNL